MVMERLEVVCSISIHTLRVEGDANSCFALRRQC